MKSSMTAMLGQVVSKRMLPLMVAVLALAGINSCKHSNVEDRMFSGLSTGKTTIFSKRDGEVKTSSTGGTRSITKGMGLADYRYEWQITGKTPVTDDVMISEVFGQQGIDLTEFTQRGAAGGTVKALYRTSAGGSGRVTWTVTPEGAERWKVNLRVEEYLPPDLQPYKIPD